MKWFMNTMLNVSSFGIDYIDKYCHVPLMRSFRLNCASNNPVICTELHAGSPSVPPPYD